MQQRERVSEPGRWGAASTEVPQHAEVNISAPPTYFICGLLAHLPIQGFLGRFQGKQPLPFKDLGDPLLQGRGLEAMGLVPLLGLWGLLPMWKG